MLEKWNENPKGKQMLTAFVATNKKAGKVLRTLQLLSNLSKSG